MHNGVFRDGKLYFLKTGGRVEISENPVSALSHRYRLDGKKLKCCENDYFTTPFYQKNKRQANGLAAQTTVMAVTRVTF